MAGDDSVQLWQLLSSLYLDKCETSESQNQQFYDQWP